MNKFKQLFGHLWHYIFVILCLAIIVFCGYKEYDNHLHQQHENQEVSSGKLSNQQLHENGILFLCYHRVSNPNLLSTKFALAISNNDQLHEYSIPADKLERQIKYLRKHDVRIISMKKAITLIQRRQPLHHKYVVLTFDDVDSTLTYNVYPLFKKLGNIPYTIFIVTSNTGRYDNGTQLATWSQLRKVLKCPNVTIGVHTNNMHYLINNEPALKQPHSFSKFKRDYLKSERIMKKHVGRKTPYFAYPYGEGTPREQQYLVKHGMVTFSLQNGIATSDQDLTQPLPRTMVDNKSWNNVIKKWVNAKSSN